jgi:hypothetical protein
MPFAAEVIRLEELLLDQSARKDLKTLQNLIADDFVEFGSSGRIFNKSDVIASLPNEQSRNFRAANFNHRLLCEGCVLLTYKLFEKNNKSTSLRSSIWLFRPSHGWQIIFHQGTYCCL